MARKAICKTGDVPAKAIRQFEAGAGKTICVINDGERFFACQAACPHEGVALCDGVFDGEVLTCLEHLWQWSLAAGGEPRGLAERPLQMFPVEVEADVVYVSTDS
ncbi:MAG: Rieske (2Fe-2S) protein [Betaproteobacteria bacterium]